MLFQSCFPLIWQICHFSVAYPTKFISNKVNIGEKKKEAITRSVNFVLLAIEEKIECFNVNVPEGFLEA